MHQDQIDHAPLDPLSAILCRSELSDKDQRLLRRLASHLLQSNIQASHPRRDGSLLAYLLGRWESALDDVDASMEVATEAFTVRADDAAWVLGREVGEVRAGMARLASDGVISAVATADGALVSFSQAIEVCSAPLASQVYRDFLSRHGRLLYELADFFLKRLGEDLSEFEANPGGRETTTLRRQFDDVAKAGDPDELLNHWATDPARTYAWLDRLVLFERELAIQSGYLSLGLSHDLQKFVSERVLILSRSLEPAVDAN